MELLIKRTTFLDTSTLGELYINDKYFSFTLEDKDRGLYETDPLSKFEKIKDVKDTCIPYGRYEVILSYSAKLKRYLPYVIDVKGFIRIRIHGHGSTINYTSGCPLVGFKKRGTNLVLQSTKDAEKELVNRLMEVNQKEVIYLTIVKV